MEPKERGNNNVHRGKADQKERMVRAALLRHIDAHPDKLEKFAGAMIDKASEGDVKAATWCRDTLDGRPVQQIEGPDGGPLMVRILKVAADGTKDG